MGDAQHQRPLEPLLDSWDRNNTILLKLLRALPAIAQMLNGSAEAVRAAVKSRVEAGQDMNLHYDHPILPLKHMLWHEGYHHGQIKLAFKVAGRPMADAEAGPVTWDIWMRKK